jgi:hypothetical protein
VTAVSVRVAVEGDSDAVLARTLLEHVGLGVETVYVQNGKQRLDRKLTAFNEAAEHAAWLVIRDLDHDANCAPELVQKLLPARSAKMCLRIAIRAAEAWLLADRANISQYRSVPASKIPLQPDTLRNPKIELVNIARKSRKKYIREDMVPARGATTQVGPGYVARLIAFTSAEWNPRKAAKNSDSLRRCIKALERLFAA